MQRLSIPKQERRKMTRTVEVTVTSPYDYTYKVTGVNIGAENVAKALHPDAVMVTFIGDKETLTIPINAIAAVVTREETNED